MYYILLYLCLSINIKGMLFMNKLKVGDIKKFNYNGEEFVGAVIKVDDEYVRLLNLDGYTKDFNRNNSEATYTATRLNPNIRERLENMVDLFKKYYKIEKDIHELKDLSSKVHNSIIKERDKLQELQGKFTFEKVGDVFLKYLTKANPNLAKKLKDKYEMEFSDCGNGTWLSFSRWEDIEKWVNPLHYSFLGRDCYNDNLIVKEENREYKELCNKYSKGDINFELSDLKGSFSSKKKLMTGDKDSLYYVHRISILFPKDCLNEDYMTKLIKTLK